jgi:hypothetical protein
MKTHDSVCISAARRKVSGTERCRGAIREMPSFIEDKEVQKNMDQSALVRVIV